MAPMTPRGWNSTRADWRGRVGLGGEGGGTGHAQTGARHEGERGEAGEEAEGGARDPQSSDLTQRGDVWHPGHDG
eukprot:4617072-Pleurochrysis_carterae.AAC.1